MNLSPNTETASTPSVTTGDDVFADIKAFAASDARSTVDREVARRRAQGYAGGWAHGLRAAEAATEAAVAETKERLAQERSRNAAQGQLALTALAEAIAQCRELNVPTVEDIMETVLDAALELAESILGHEVVAARTPGRDALARALTAAADTAITKVRLHPDQAAQLSAVEVPDGIELVADPTLSPGDAVAENPLGSIEVLLQDALQRARTELGLTPDE